VHHISLEMKNGDKQELFFDAESMILIEIQQTAEYQGQSIPVTVTLGDYRPVGGLLQPHSIQVNQGGQLITYNLETYEANVDIDPTIFDMPSKEAEK
jgi:hypothetical protein